MKTRKFLTHGGIESPLRKVFHSTKDNNSKAKITEFNNKTIIVDKTNLPPPKGETGTLLIHFGKETKSVKCYKSEIPVYVFSCSGATGGLFNKKRFTVTESDINWKY